MSRHRTSRLGPGRFLAAMAAQSPRRLVWVLAVQVTAALTQGVGLLLLVPLLEVAGVGRSPSAGGLAQFARDIFGALGVSLTLRAMLLAYVAMVAVTAGLVASQNVMLVRYRVDFVDSLRRRLYGAVARAEWRHLLGLRQSDLLTALTVDVNWAGQGTLAALNLGVAAVVITVQVAVAVRISPEVTALAVVTGAALVALVWPLIGRSRRLGRELVDHNRGVLASVTGFLDGLKLAKAHGLEPGHVSAFETGIGRARRSQVDFAKASAVATAVQLTVTAAVLAVLVEVAVDQLGLPLPELLVLAFIFTRLVPQVTQAQSQMQSLAQALPAFDELTDVITDCEHAAELSGEHDSPRRRPVASRLALTDRLCFDNVSFSYQQPSSATVEVLHRVTLKLPARTTTALIGPSGAGKTTIADLAVGLLTPTSGVVTLDGQPLDRELVGSWRDAVAMVPQDPFLFHDTIRANLLWANGRADECEMWEALAMASAAEFVRGLVEGLDTVVGDRGARLSGGERQRIALARAVLRQPELLVLDEATSSLDLDNENVILDALAALHGKMTVLVISHQQSTIRDADQIVSLAGGRVAGLVPTQQGSLL